MTIRVLLVDDHAMMRTGLAGVLGSDPEIEVVGEAGDGAEAVSEAGRLRPDVVLMDIEMPGVDGVTAIGRLGQVVPSARCLVLTTFDVDDYVLGALRAGAAGFLLKTTPPRELIRAVKDCAAGGSALGPSVVRRLVASYVGSAREAVPELDRLTERERDVLTVMARGLSNAEIGAELFLTENTVRTHVAHILAKLGVRDRVQAVILAHRSGVG
ncbi:response regulator [Ornithinimicrobium sp. W1679]|uniref:response regulator n=1 Tax=Ornithinimicrobium sp. W1679 TaxID=3418770 RepID=UPI003CF9DD41